MVIPPKNRDSLKSRLELIKPHFIVQEFVSKRVYDLLGDYAILLIDRGIIETVVAVREFFQCPVVINTWKNYGAIDGRGYRDLKENTGSTGSMHRKGGALDFVVQGISSRIVRETIIANRHLFPHVTRMEDKVEWVHIDNKFTEKVDIELFQP